MKPIDDYLKKLESCLDGMTVERRQAVLAEVEGHLRDEAMELGGDESAAVRRFGDPFLIAKRMQQNERKVDGTVALGSVAAHLSFIVLTAGSKMPAAVWIAVGAGGVLLVGFAVKRLTLASIGVSCAAAATAIGLVMPAMWLIMTPRAVVMSTTPLWISALGAASTALISTALLLAVWAVRRTAVGVFLHSRVR